MAEETSEQGAKKSKNVVLNELGMSRNPLVERMDMFQNLWRRMTLSWHLFKDPEVPLVSKAIPVLTLIYVFSPLDFLPDLLGPLGLVDDIVLLGASFDLFVRLVPDQIVMRHAHLLGYVSAPKVEEIEE